MSGYRRLLMNIDDGSQKSNEIWYEADAKLTLYNENGVLSHTFDAQTGIGKIVKNACILTFPDNLRGTAVKNIYFPKYTRQFVESALQSTTSLHLNGMPLGFPNVNLPINVFKDSTAFQNTDLVSWNVAWNDAKIRSLVIPRSVLNVNPTSGHQKINCCLDVTIQGDLSLTSNYANSFFYSSLAATNSWRVKKLTIYGTVSFASTVGANYRKLFAADNAYSLQSGTTLHFRYSGVACSASEACASYTRVSKIYVGDGSSAEHDNAILAMYLANAGWATYASKLDTEYNYLNQ